MIDEQFLQCFYIAVGILYILRRFGSNLFLQSMFLAIHTKNNKHFLMIVFNYFSRKHLCIIMHGRLFVIVHPPFTIVVTSPSSFFPRDFATNHVFFLSF